MNEARGSLEQWHTGVPLSARGPIILGFGILLLCIGGFAVWAGLAPLQGAVVASGTFVATGQNKLVQHLEGGIIRDLLVNEGDLVDSNQVLVRMDDTAANAKLRRLVLRKFRMVTMQAGSKPKWMGARPSQFHQSLRRTVVTMRRSGRYLIASALSSSLAGPVWQLRCWFCRGRLRG